MGSTETMTLFTRTPTRSRGLKWPPGQTSPKFHVLWGTLYVYYARNSIGNYLGFYSRPNVTKAVSCFCRGTLGVPCLYGGVHSGLLQGGSLVVNTIRTVCRTSSRIYSPRRPNLLRLHKLRTQCFHPALHREHSRP